MPKKHRKRTEEFKREAVQLMLSRGDRTIAEVAESLGVAEHDLFRWRLKYAGPAETAAAAMPKETAEQAEIVGSPGTELEFAL